VKEAAVLWQHTSYHAGVKNMLGTKRFAPSVVSGSSPVIAHMMATGGLHGR